MNNDGIMDLVRYALDVRNDPGRRNHQNLLRERASLAASKHRYWTRRPRDARANSIWQGVVQEAKATNEKS